ncbi:MAG: FdtA/QdtA family cupin domain-containing protein [Dysgonamonadaceae bacterium]|jgi:oxalate decarboxylase/phosphoglucose isomerase-like protein (cupin superfamily)|nr:FdtA/QdtA family cupin domain-containing protein [Dysgonamonadaceae bacterium]
MEENKVALFDIPRILDVRGNLSFIEKGIGLRFDMKRVYWIYDVPGGEIRGSHAFIEQEEVIVALSGSFDVVLHDGEAENRFSLNRSYKGLYIPRMYWRRMENFSTNSVCLVMASTRYREDDYIKDFELFLKMKKG